MSLIIFAIQNNSNENTFSVSGSFASTLDSNRYKFLTKMQLDDVEIIKCKLNDFYFLLLSVTSTAFNCLTTALLNRLRDYKR